MNDGRRVAQRGLYFEELEEGVVYEHAPRRTLTEADNVLFTTLTMNTQPLHLDHEFASQTRYGGPIVNGFLTLGLMVGMTVNDISRGTTLGNLGMSDVRFPAPVMPGDTLRSVTEIESVRQSKSIPGAGVVGLQHSAVNQRGELVCLCRRAALISKDPDGRPSNM